MNCRLLLIGGCFLASGAFLIGQEYEGRELIKAELLADSETLVPGQPLTVGIRLEIAEGWHTYWKNPGDSGMAGAFEWDLPDGVRAGAFQWPLPERKEEPGGLKVYGYRDEAVLLARVFTRPDFDAEEVTLRVSADWLVCEAICLPGDAELSLTLDVAEEKRPVNTAFFDEARGRLPERLQLADTGIETRWERENRTLYLMLKNLPEGTDADFYPLPEAGVLTGHASPAESGIQGTDFEPEAVLALPLEAAPDDVGGLGGLLILEGNDGSRRGLLL